MRMKRALALLLSVATLCGMLILPTAAAPISPAFTDIQQSDVAEAAETLRLLGIVNGTGGTSFLPNRALTRAEFCKMAVELMGSGGKVAAQMNRTVFKDVPSTHWARGYIAVATQTTQSDSDSGKSFTPGIIRGDAYGNFSPDRPITYAEAVTILVRILGYGDSDVGMTWPTGYLSKASELDLTDGVTLSASDSVTRGQTALMMENLLFIAPKNSKEEYLTTLGCKIADETIIYAVDATAADGSIGVGVPGDKVYKTDHAGFSSDLVGRRAKLVLDEDEKVLAIQPSTNGTQKVVSILSLGYDSMKVSGGAAVSIDKPKAAKVYQDGKEETTYEQMYLKGTAVGTQAVLQYSAAGELEYIFLRGSVKADNSTRVVKNKPSYSGNLPYAVYKNGVLSSGEEIRQYDVTTFDQGSNVMYVSDTRITGVYENVYPNLNTPATITLMGQDFPVLPSAYSDLNSFKIGSAVTLLLSYNGQVAGAVSPSVAKSTTVGTITDIAENGTTKITTLNLTDPSGKPMVLEGLTSYSGDRADTMRGQLVSVSSSTKGRLSLSPLTGNGSKQPLNVAKRSMGTVALADNVKLYEQVGKSVLEEIELGDITRATVPTDKITYVRVNYAGKADLVVFNDVTGDRYDYGLITYDNSDTTPTLSVTNATKTTDALIFREATGFYASSMGGLVE